MDNTNATIDFAVYEDGNEYLGIARVTLPGKTYKTISAQGAGVAGDVDLPLPVQEAKTCTINFREVTLAAHRLAEYRVHTLDLRVAKNKYDSASGIIGVSAHKHILKVIPRSLGGGDVAPASAQEVSGEYSVISNEEYIDGVLVEKYDPFNYQNVDASGEDRLGAVRSALGK